MFGSRPVPALGAGIAICLIALSPVARVSAAAAAQDNVRLNFAWPTNLKAGVSFFYSQARKGGGAPRSITVYGGYDSRVVPVSDGLRITTENSDIRVRSRGYPDGPRARLRQFLAKASGSQPAFVIDRSGQFVRLEELAKYRKALQDGLNAVFADSPPELRAKIADAVAPSLSEEQLQASIVSQWNRIVGAWLEAELDIGDLYQLEFERPVPVLGNSPVRMVTDIKFVKRAPCSERDRGRNCAELFMRTVIDDKSAARAIEKRTAQLLGGKQAVMVKSYHTEETIRLLTEPGTLVPHRMHSVKKTATTVEANGKAESVEQIDETKVAYKY